MLCQSWRIGGLQACIHSCIGKVIFFPSVLPSSATNSFVLILHLWFILYIYTTAATLPFPSPHRTIYLSSAPSHSSSIKYVHTHGYQLPSYQLSHRQMAASRNNNFLATAVVFLLLVFVAPSGTYLRLTIYSSFQWPSSIHLAIYMFMLIHAYMHAEATNCRHLSGNFHGQCWGYREPECKRVCLQESSANTNGMCFGLFNQQCWCITSCLTETVASANAPIKPWYHDE